MKDDTLNFGGIFTSMWIWSHIAWASTISTPLYSHNLLRYFPISVLNLAYIAFRRYFGVNTIWYWQFHFVCDKLLVSSFLIGIKSFPFHLGVGNWTLPLYHGNDFIFSYRFRFFNSRPYKRRFYLCPFGPHNKKKLGFEANFFIILLYFNTMYKF